MRVPSVMLERWDVRPGGSHCTRFRHSSLQKSRHRRRRTASAVYLCSWLHSWGNRLRISQKASGIAADLSPTRRVACRRVHVAVKATNDRKGGWGLFPSFNSWEESAGADEDESLETTVDEEESEVQPSVAVDEREVSTSSNSRGTAHVDSSRVERTQEEGVQHDKSNVFAVDSLRPSPLAVPSNQHHTSQLEHPETHGRQQPLPTGASPSNVDWRERREDRGDIGAHRGVTVEAVLGDRLEEGLVEYVHESELESTTKTEWEDKTLTEFQPWPAPPVSPATLAEQKASGWALAFAVLLAVRLGRENSEAERYDPAALQVKQQESRVQSKELREKRKQYLEQERKAKEAEAERRVEEARLKREKEEKERKERERQQRIEAAEATERLRIQQEAARKAYLENEKRMEEEIAKRAEIERQILLENEKKRQEEEEQARLEREAQIRAEEEARRRAAEEAAARAAEMKRQQQLEKQRLRAMTTWYGMKVKAAATVGPAPDGSLTEGRVARPASIQVTMQLSCSHSPTELPTIVWQPGEDDTLSSQMSSPQISPRDLYDDAEDFFPSQKDATQAYKSRLTRNASAPAATSDEREDARTRVGVENLEAAAEVQRMQCFSSIEEAADDFPATAGAVAQRLVEEYMSGPGVQDALALMDETELNDWMRAAALRVSGMVLDAVMVILQTMQRKKSDAASSTSTAGPESFDWEAEVLIERGVLPLGHKKRVDTLHGHAAQVCQIGLLGEAETVLLTVLEDTESEWTRGGLASLPSSAIPVLISTSVCAHVLDRSTTDIDSKSRLYQFVKHQLETRVRDAPRDTLLPISRMLTSITGSSHPIAKIMAELADRNLSYAKRESLRLRRRQEQWELSQRAAQLSEPTAAESAAARMERRDSLTPIPERVWALRNVAGNILAGGDPGHAASMLMQASELSEEHFGTNHPGRLGVLLDLCEALSAAPDADSAPLASSFETLFDILQSVVERYQQQGDNVSAATLADAVVRTYDGRIGKEFNPWIEKLKGAASEAVQKLSTAENRTVLNRRRTPGMRVLRQLATDFSEQLGAYSASSTSRTSLLDAWNKNLPLPPTR